ncbi:MAG: nucleoside recognition domain-containing protein [Bacillota bacterium]|nr:spore maturation protein [Bacillota bacterium]MDD3297437.1 spore maturation protein [Bacillota bacterium]MDD3850249.1 spore maturation protein [Bacillota bacterium]MDD4707206.1 spore maturation protein [Bacillota bacterium]
MRVLIETLSAFAVPLLIALVLIHGYKKGVKVYEVFVEGAAEGIKTSVRILPYLTAILMAIGIFRSSGAMDILMIILKTPAGLLGIPAEIMPLVLIRPLSGSGALGVVSEIFATYGPDSFVGRAAGTMMGSTETIFYTIAVYFGAVGIRDTRHVLPSAFVADLAGVVASVVVCRLIFG